VTFSGSASDDLDTGLTASLTWTSSINGPFGIGGTISTSTLSLGEHTITASVTDSGGLTGSQSIIVTIVNTPTVPPGSSTVDVRVASGDDDAEESATGSVSLTSSDLELVADGSNQTVGMRFNGIAIPKRATITNAWIQFQTDQVSTGLASLTIRGQAADNPTTFTTTAANVSSRLRTTAAVPWSPPDWPSVGAALDPQRTPNLTSVIQELVNRDGWASGNSMVLIISGTGQRVAESYNGLPTAAPLLHIEAGPSDPAPDIDAVPNPYGFGPVVVNATASGSIEIRNVGTQDLAVTAIGLGGADAAQFAITQGGGGFTLAPNATHTITVTFTPTSVGSKTATLQLTTNDPDESTFNVGLTGSGTTPANIDVTPTTQSYGSVPVGSTASRSVTVRNTGGANLVVSATTLGGTDSGQFSITSGGGSFTLATNATRNIDVRFAPTSDGAKSATLQLTSNDPDGSPFTVSLSGTGTTAPDIAVSPTTYSYGAQSIGSSATRVFTVSNTGNVNLVVSPSTLSGPDSTAFAFVSGQAGFTLSPGGSSSIEVRFTPTTEGAKSATLSIPSNDPDQNENPFLISLSGSGVVAGANPPTFIEVQQGGSAASATVTTGAALTGVNGHLYLAAVSTKGPREVTAITGLSLSWARLAAQCSGRNQTNVEIWWARGAATTGTVTATLASAPTNAVIAVARYSGVSATNPVALLVGGNTNGASGACANGVDSNAYSFNVATGQNNSLVFGAVASRNHAHTPGTGYTERVEATQGTSGGDAVRVSFVERAVPTTSSLLLNGTLANTTDWAVIGVVLRP
jgi:DNA/RNA endonuclease YhcR with UshA esterase domain